MESKSLQVGDKVSYGAVIGREITSTGHIINKIMRTDGGEMVAFISGKSGYVSLDALTKEQRTGLMKNYICGSCGHESIYPRCPKCKSFRKITNAPHPSVVGFILIVIFIVVVVIGILTSN